MDGNEIENYAWKNSNKFVKLKTDLSRRGKVVQPIMRKVFSNLIWDALETDMYRRRQKGSNADTFHAQVPFVKISPRLWASLRATPASSEKEKYPE